MFGALLAELTVHWKGWVVPGGGTDPEFWVTGDGIGMRAGEMKPSLYRPPLAISGGGHSSARDGLTRVDFPGGEALTETFA